MTALVEIRRLEAGYGRVPVIADASIEIERGRCVALIGPNGAGKSTFLKAIAGALLKVSGSVKIDDVEYCTCPTHEIVAAGLVLVPEGRHVFADLNVADNLLLGSLRLGNRRQHLETQRRAVFQLFPRLQERSAQRAGTLSGGEQQMLAIGRALMSRPRIMLLDEPFMGLAPLVIDEIVKAIQTLRDQGVSLLIVEQKSEQVMDLCSRVYVMSKGAIVLDSTPSDLRSSSGILDAYFGRST